MGRLCRDSPAGLPLRPTGPEPRGRTRERALPPPAPSVQNPAGGAASATPVSCELQRILKLEVPVIVQLADREMTMEEILDLNVGSIIEFDKRFDAELELIVTNRQIGLGHAVKVGENFGLRITRIGSIYNTIKALGG